MKKSLSIITLIVLVAAMVFTLAACQPNLPDEDIAPTSVTLYTPDGAPAMSVAKIIADGKIGDTTATVEIAQNAQDIVAKATKAERELELAVLPTNAAATVYNATKGDYVLFSINTYGLLYIMGTEEVSDLNALKGQVLYSIGMGQVPQYVFDKVLAHAGIQKVNNSDVAEEGKLAVKYADNAQGITPLLLQGKAKFGLLGEPAATQLEQKPQPQARQFTVCLTCNNCGRTLSAAQRRVIRRHALLSKRVCLQTKPLPRRLTGQCPQMPLTLRKTQERLKLPLPVQAAKLTWTTRRKSSLVATSATSRQTATDLRRNLPRTLPNSVSL